MSDTTLLPLLAVFAAVGILFLAIWYIVSSLINQRRQLMQRRMGGTGDSDPSIVLRELPGEAPTDLSTKVNRGFDRMIERTGLDMTPAMALAIIVFFGMVLAAVVFFWRFEEEPWLGVPAFFLGALAPLLFFYWRKGVWHRTLQNQLPDALFLLARSMRAGRSIDQAIALVGEHGQKPLSREFVRMQHQLELGLSLSQVVQNAAARLEIVDFSVFASVLSLHRVTGGSLPVLLDRLATTTRDRNNFRRQFRAATVLGRWSAAVILVLVAVILIYLFFFHPERQWVMRFFETSTGLAIFLSAIALEVLGLATLFWMLNYEY
jgi:tight adherence protein B